MCLYASFHTQGNNMHRSVITLVEAQKLILSSNESIWFYSCFCITLRTVMYIYPKFYYVLVNTTLAQVA